MYSLLLRYGNGSGCRMPSRRLLAERLHRSMDSIDRAMRELESTRIVRVERRRRGRVNLTNRYHLRTSDPRRPQPTASRGSRRSAATRTGAATGGRTDAVTLAADLRPDRENLTDPPPPPTPSGEAHPPARSAEESKAARITADEQLLTECGIDDLDALAHRCQRARRVGGHPATRWAAPCLLAAIQVAVRVRGWPPGLVARALLAVAADHTSHSPMRLAEAGPWWDQAEQAATTAFDPAAVQALEAELDTVAGRRPALQAQARDELHAEDKPLTRTTVITRAVEILHRQEESP